MPIFAYQCRGCGHRFDELQRLGAAPLTDCPECHRPALDKLLSAPNFHLKGGGWRKSDAAPKVPSTRPKFAHTFDSPVPHADHHGHDHSHDHSHDSGGATAPRAPRGHDHDH